MILSAKWIKKPRKVYQCEDCKCQIGDAHLYLYGACDYGDKPYGIRFCKGCTIKIVEATVTPTTEHRTRDNQKILDAVKGHVSTGRSADNG